MNFKTTLALLVLLASGAGLVWTGMALPPRLDPFPADRQVAAEDEGGNAVLAGLRPASLQRIEVERGKERTVLTRAADGSWVMPGNWPTRAAEVQHLLDTLGGLRSRFAPIPVEEDGWKQYGLDRPAVTVHVKGSGGEHRLAFADAPPDEDNTRFDRPTYLRIDDEGEVLRLGPGLVALLDRPPDYYQQRRLFPSERVPREEGNEARADRLAGTRLEVRERGELKYAIVKGPHGWELSQPKRDALDPRSRDALLEAVPDIWAERFLPPEKGKDLAEMGLKVPDRVLTVTRADGGTVTLEIGKPALDAVPNNRSYARLKGFDRVFEINPDRLNAVYVSLDVLRDNQLARFKSEDAREVLVSTKRGSMVLRNDAPPRKPDDTTPAKGDWKLVKPVAAKADSALVDRLLSTLSGLSAVEKDMAEKLRTSIKTAGLAAPAAAGATASRLEDWLLAPGRLEKTYDLDKPAAMVKVTVEEGKGTARKARTISLRIGKHDGVTKRLFAQSQDYPRINEVDDSLVELVLDKTSLDYRGKRLLDFLSFDVERIEIKRQDLGSIALGLLGLPNGYAGLGAAGVLASNRAMDLALARASDGWALTSPVKAEADAGKVNDLADKLGKLEVLAFVANSADAAELQTRYGLGLPALSVTVSFTGGKKPSQTLHIGKIRQGAPGYFARLEGAPEVFVIGSELRDQLDRDSLDYRPGTLWQVLGGDEIVKLRIAKAGQEEYQLVRKGDGWQVTGPFTVAAPREVVDKLTSALQAPKVDEYRVHAAKDFAPFGLASPEVKLTLTTKKGKEHSLSLGARPPDGVGRYAKLGNGSAVFVVGRSLAKTVDQSALDFLDKQILKIDSGAVTQFVRKKGADVLELVKKDDAWRMVKPAEQPADEKKVPELLKELGELKAARIVAYKPKDFKPFGLDAPSATVTVKVGADKPAEQVLELGKEPAADSGERYAMVKGSPEVGVLPAAAVKKLLAGPLAYRDHALARVPDADTIKLEAGERRATFAKPEGSWKLVQPLSADADHDALEGFLNNLARLRADELVADNPQPEQLKDYGLDKPPFRWQFLSGDKVELDLSVGAVEKNGSRRYARMAGKSLVFLLDTRLSRQVAAEYRPRVVFKENVDPAQIESVRFGYRKEPFELKKVGNDWEVVGRPDEKVDAKRVSDTLSVLRDLKLERYVKDAGAQLKLYGLDPPELVLRVSTPSGSHTLEIGGLEGTSKRRYARVPVKGQTGVFVLDEATSSKLFRDLAGLQK
jgi:hypothetical protein